MDDALTWSQRAAWYEIEERPTAEELRFWLAACTGAPSVLVVPGGTGSLAMALATTTRRTVVADSEKRMVSRASARLAACPGDNMACLGDMRSVELSETFSRVCVPRAALQLLSPVDQYRALVALGRHVDAEGLLVLELVQLGGDLCGSTPFYRPTLPDGETVLEWVRRLPDGGYLARRRTQHHADSGVELRFEYTTRTDKMSAAQAPADAHITVQLYPVDKDRLEDGARRAGLVIGRDRASVRDVATDARSCRLRLALSRPDHGVAPKSSERPVE